MNRAIHNARMKNLESDTALNLARAAVVAKENQRTNSSKDLPSTQTNMSPSGQTLRSPMSSIRLGGDASTEILEQEYGGIISEIHGLLRWFKDYRNQQPRRYINKPKHDYIKQGRTRGNMKKRSGGFK